MKQNIDNYINEEKFKLIPYEKYIFNYTRLSDFLVLSTTILNLQGGVVLEEAVVKSALKYMQLRHPMLRTHLRFDPNSTDIYFEVEEDLENMRPVDFEWKKISSSREDLIKHLAEFNATRFDYQNKCLLWKAQILEIEENGSKRYAMSIGVPDCFTDGINITTASVEIVSILNALLTGTECNEMRERLELTEDSNTVSQLYGFFGKREQENFEKLASNGGVKFHKFMLPEKFRDQNQSGTQLKFIRISKEVTQRVIQSCKLRHMKVNGFFNAVIVSALRDLFAQNGLEFPDNLSCGKKYRSL
jgi:hypothetical protein